MNLLERDIKLEEETERMTKLEEIDKSTLGEYNKQVLKDMTKKIIIELCGIDIWEFELQKRHK